MLHFLIKVLTFLFMFEVGDELLDGSYYFFLGEGWLMENLLYLVKPGINFGHGAALGFLYHAQCTESIHIQFLTGDKEFFVGLLESSILLKINDRVILAVVGHF